MRYARTVQTEYTDQRFGLGGVTGRSIGLQENEDDRANPAWCAFNNQTYYTVDPVITLYSTTYTGFGKRILHTQNCDELFCRYFDPNDPEAFLYHS